MRAIASRRERFEADGFLVLPGFASSQSIAALRARATEIVAAFDPSESRTIFTTRDESTKADRYFLTSAQSAFNQ
jgi:phytanoyl-CoA hydroxylase